MAEAGLDPLLQQVQDVQPPRHADHREGGGGRLAEVEQVVQQGLLAVVGEKVEAVDYDEDGPRGQLASGLEGLQEKLEGFGHRAEHFLLHHVLEPQLPRDFLHGDAVCWWFH